MCEAQKRKISKKIQIKVNRKQSKKKGGRYKFKAKKYEKMMTKKK